MRTASSLLLALALLPTLATAADAPPLLPPTAAFEDLAVPASGLREFDIELARTEKYLAFQLQSADGKRPLSGALLISSADNGAPLYDRSLDGSAQLGALIPLPTTTAAKRRVRVSLRGGADDMRVDMRLLPRPVQLRTGQVVPVFSRRRGSDVFDERFELRLTKAADVDVVTWGGDATAKLTVSAAQAGGAFPVARCESLGDAWRRCTLPALEAGDYTVQLSGNGSPVNLLATWKPLAEPNLP